MDITNNLTTHGDVFVICTKPEDVKQTLESVKEMADASDRIYIIKESEA